LGHRATFAKKTYFEEGRPWWEWHQIVLERLKTQFSIIFAFVATHNHFVLDRGGKVFKQSAPLIKLPPEASEEDYLGLLGLLNSSVACFWLKQVCHDKGGGGIGGGLATEAWERFIEVTATNVLRFPLVMPFPAELARKLDRLSELMNSRSPAAILSNRVPTRAILDEAREKSFSIRRNMIALQEELDWHCYSLYGLLDETVEYHDPPPISLGQRAFEIAMARQMVAGVSKTTWFQRHGSTPVTDIPKDWPSAYRSVVERRLALIKEHNEINLIERPEYKRRWQWEQWEVQEKIALSKWLANRLESSGYWGSQPTIRSLNQLAEQARTDTEFLAVGALFTGRADFDAAHVVRDLVQLDSVPFLSVFRYTADGMRKRAAWERVWNLQRQEDAGQKVGEISSPPKYKPNDFRSSEFWRLRGGLDVPKERFVSYPGAARDADGSLPVMWAGYDHRQQAQALWAYYEDRKLNDGWATERLIPLLAGLNELLPWLKQWHNERDAATGTRFGDFMEQLIVDEARGLGLTPDQLRAWIPPAVNERSRRRKKRPAVNTIVAEDLE
jgi:hypothetical protein